MKQTIKISSRERLLLSVAPGLVILCVYFFFIVGGLTASLEKETRRAAAAAAPSAPPDASPTLAKARSALAETKKSVADAQDRIDELRTRLASLPRGSDTINDGRTIAQVEEVFARNGIVPVISEAATENPSANRVSSTLLGVLSPQTDGDPNAAAREQHVWHYIFDDLTPHFQQALDEVTHEVPTALPLSFNLVYNPATRGQTRLLELWLLY